jgi:mandelate racemase
MRDTVRRLAEEFAMRAERLTYRSVTVRQVLLPLRRPVVAKIGRFDEWPLVLIDLETEEGIVGRSYLGPYQKQAARYIVPALHDLAMQRKGRPVRPADDFRQGLKALNLVGYEGVSMIAVSGLDMAAWDALAKAAGMPLAVLLGGSLEPVPAYNSNGLWLTDLASLADEARELKAEGGFGAMKLRLGRDRLADDIAAIEAVRSGAGGDIELMTDFNQGLSLGDALHRCHALDGLGLYWFEEPVTYTDLDGYAQLARELATPVQLGENLYGPHSVHRALEMRAGDYLMPDLMRIGGVTGWLRAAALAGAHGIEMSSHLYPEFSAHLLRVTESAHWLEWQDWANPVLAAPFEVSGGQLVIPNRPGAGVEWNEDAVRRYSYAI